MSDPHSVISTGFLSGVKTKMDRIESGEIELTRFDCFIGIRKCFYVFHPLQVRD